MGHNRFDNFYTHAPLTRILFLNLKKINVHYYQHRTANMKKYVVYRNPLNDYESFVERFSLREKAKNCLEEKRGMIRRAEKQWKEIFSKNKDDLKSFLKLLPGEREFVR